MPSPDLSARIDKEEGLPGHLPGKALLLLWSIFSEPLRAVCVRAGDPRRP